jgi:hypothetical protein
MAGHTGVLDACHALQATNPVPPAGELTRQVYLNETLDQNKAHGNADAKKAGNTGSCCRNP